MKQVSKLKSCVVLRLTGKYLNIFMHDLQLINNYESLGLWKLN